MSKIVRIRKGLNGFNYSACTDSGQFICNFNKLSDARKHWKTELKMGLVVLVRELDKMPL